jgi:hypothetical protein
MQPRKYSKKNFKMELQKKPKTTLKVLEKPTVLSYEELGGLSDPGLCVAVPVLVMLDILIVSVKYVFVSVKLVCLCEAFENLKCK